MCFLNLLIGLSRESRYTQLDESTFGGFLARIFGIRQQDRGGEGGGTRVVGCGVGGGGVGGVGMHIIYGNI